MSNSETDKEDSDEGFSNEAKDTMKDAFLKTYPWIIGWYI
jgi:hypothetical protein